MPKSQNNPLKVAKKLQEEIILFHEKDDFPGPLFVVAAALQHISVLTKYSMLIETMKPMMVAYFATLNSIPHTIVVLLRLAWMKAWLYHDKPCLKMLRKYYKAFGDNLCDYLKSKPTKAIAEEMLDAEPEEGNMYRQAFFRYKSCSEYPDLMKVEYISQLPFNLDWIGAHFCHLVKVHRPDLEEEVLQEMARHPGFIGHLAEISDEYIPSEVA